MIETMNFLSIFTTCFSVIESGGSNFPILINVDPCTIFMESSANSFVRARGESVGTVVSLLLKVDVMTCCKTFASNVKVVAKNQIS
jgi:hypothetical protein